MLMLLGIVLLSTLESLVPDADFVISWGSWTMIIMVPFVTMLGVPPDVHFTTYNMESVSAELQTSILPRFTNKVRTLIERPACSLVIMQSLSSTKLSRILWTI